MTARRAVLAAGGTGGHMFPAQALAETLKARGWAISLLTDARGMRHADGIPADDRRTLSAASIIKSKPWTWPMASLAIWRGYRQARRLMKDQRPDILIGFGGYPAFPAMMAAKSLNIPIIIHEQNAVLGRVNRVRAGTAAVVASGFDRLARLPDKARDCWQVTGNPLRAPILKAAGAPYEAPDDHLRLVVLGGSLGARILSETVPAAVARLPQDIRSRLEVVQQTREENLDAARETYREAGVVAVCEPFFRDVAGHLRGAHLVIARAGASTVSELAAVGRPAILIPLKIAMDDHQTENARSLADVGAADVVSEDELSIEGLAALLQTRLGDSEDLARRAAAAKTAGRPDATERLAALAEAVADPGAPEEQE
ncbi:MAG: undecaprenyldiphospho-muramoylpentapeptide beta-N-acetylglucosaminyltransferase [Euryhalocaulis sp.]|uniref:undecaprenyldiphospho-muramoylpentapeptide beta-N-acetylglucosaminyltransferase n=1 Tax=Euryhalocaulis sp. TaxID=2744307 RepID=UPI00178EC1FC|nr:undecaprenyldiphospho-muramoylpentapeptide beta-N-acetylglucosaminyltransferase [Euryhalocaulis sp.]MBA4802813.1 undecaprenyldiphospho-muramoylpentapeptide beta-N-acetylglucosaminyltransferase [Euryhalocaulis sp.]